MGRPQKVANGASGSQHEEVSWRSSIVRTRIAEPSGHSIEGRNSICICWVADHVRTGHFWSARRSYPALRLLYSHFEIAVGICSTFGLLGIGGYGLTALAMG
jgi:hypothetical protein